MSQTGYPLKSWVLKNHFSFKLRQHGQQQLYFQCKVCWILYKMVRCTFIFTTLLVHTTNAAISRRKQFFYFSQLLSPYATRTKPSLQSPLTLPSSIAQQFFASFLRTTIPTIYTKNIFPKSVISSIQVASRDQGARESFEDWQCFNFSLLPQSMDSENRAYNDWFCITQVLKTGVLQVWQTIQLTFSQPIVLTSIP